MYKCNANLHEKNEHCISLTEFWDPGHKTPYIVTDGCISTGGRVRSPYPCTNIHAQWHTAKQEKRQNS